MHTTDKQGSGSDSVGIVRASTAPARENTGGTERSPGHLRSASGTAPPPGASPIVRAAAPSDQMKAVTGQRRAYLKGAV